MPNVVLVGVEVQRCVSCGRQDVVLPRVLELYQTIAMAVVRKPTRLSGPEVRFLRKYLNWSSADLARRAGVDPSTVSGWESDKDPIGATSDRMLRLMVVHAMGAGKYLLDDLEGIENRRTGPRGMRLLPKARGWSLEGSVA